MNDFQGLLKLIVEAELGGGPKIPPNPASKAGAMPGQYTGPLEGAKSGAQAIDAWEVELKQLTATCQAGVNKIIKDLETMKGKDVTLTKQLAGHAGGINSLLHKGQELKKRVTSRPMPTDWDSSATDELIQQGQRLAPTPGQP